MLFNQDKYKQLLKDYPRDYSGSPKDVYAQLILTIHSHIHDAIYPLLTKANKEGKQLAINDQPYLDADIMVHEYTVDDIILVDSQ